MPKTTEALDRIADAALAEHWLINPGIHACATRLLGRRPSIESDDEVVALPRTR